MPSTRQLAAGSIASLVLLLLGSLSAAETRETGKPNIILIYTDDQGYNDLGCFGSTKIKTPRIDRMAAQGVKLTSYYSAAPVCGPSRAAVLTGRHPKRISEPGGKKNYHTILAGSEITVAELLKRAGYHTLAIGKWHLAGSGGQAVGTDRSKKGLARFGAKNPNLMPTAQGFDEYFGIPYSNDMSPSVLMRGVEFIEAPVEQTTITRRYTDEAIGFVEKHRKDPFFIYLAHSMPHTPLWTEKRFDGVSEYGPYGDCLEEIDFHTGRLLDKLEELKLEKNTLVIFTSDNGPWLSVAPFPKADQGRTPDNRDRQKQSGTAKPLRGAKMTSFEGGHRVPFVAWWPGRIPAGKTEDRIVTSLDLFSTFAHLAGADLPDDRVVDGKNAMPVLDGSGNDILHEAFYYYKHTYLLAVRSGNWKLLLPRPAFPRDLGWYGRFQHEIEKPQLYDLDADIGEESDVADDHPEAVARLLKLAAAARADLGDANPLASSGEDDPIGATRDADPSGPDLSSRLKDYFGAGEAQRRNTPEFWGDFEVLTREAVEPAREAIFKAARNRAIADGREKQFREGTILFANPFGIDQVCPMPFVIKTKGERPPNGWPAYINIHGSGPIDREYEIHQKRHRFFSGKLVVPRSPHKETKAPGEGKTVGIWRHALIPAIEQLATDLVMFEDVDPNRIYLMGFSEGGYFTYRAIPSMCDRLAGAAPSAGGGVKDPGWVDNLVTLPFFVQSGEFDNAFKRAPNFREMVGQLKEARERYPDRLRVRAIEYKNHGHQIPDTRKESSPPLWLEQFTRDPTPDLVIWQQRRNVEANVNRKGDPNYTFPYVAENHYWIAVDDLIGDFSRIEARYKDNEIHLQSGQYMTLTVRLNDAMVDFSKPVKIYFNDALVYEGTPVRRLSTMIKTWEEREDPGLIFPAEVRVSR